MKSFVIKSSLLTFIVLIIGAVFYSTLLRPFYLEVLPWAVALFYIGTNLVHAYLLKISVSSGSRFTSHYMAASFSKMFFYLTVGIVYAMIYKEDAKIFLINFLLLYAIYTTFEVIEFSKIVRQKNK